jgi:hypothetical protein
MLLEGRQEVKIRTHKDEARLRDQLMSGQAVHGKLWIVYLAISSSVHTMLQGVLDEYKRKQSSIEKAHQTSAKHSLCDNCGEYAAKMNRCGQCKDRYYCSRDCQSKDWPAHKKVQLCLFFVLFIVCIQTCVVVLDLQPKEQTIICIETS